MDSLKKCHKRGKSCRFQMQGFLRAAILLVLSKGEGYGYTLQQDIIKYGLRKQVDIGSIYRNLRTLEEAGFVKSEWRDSSVGPEKRVYILTDAGFERLREWESVLIEKRLTINTFLRLLDTQLDQQ